MQVLNLLDLKFIVPVLTLFELALQIALLSDLRLYSVESHQQVMISLPSFPLNLSFFNFLLRQSHFFGLLVRPRVLHEAVSYGLGNGIDRVPLIEISANARHPSAGMDLKVRLARVVTRIH